jgi:hypothetical protein
VNQYYAPSPIWNEKSYIYNYNMEYQTNNIDIVQQHQQLQETKQFYINSNKSKFISLI